MHLLLLGSPTLQADAGSPVQFDTRKAIALLAYLALQDQPFQRDTLAALLWPDLDQSHARAALRRTLTPLNHALGGHALLATRETIALNPAYSLWVDARAFQQLIAETEFHGHPHGDTCPRCFEPLSQAVALHRGDFLEGFTLRDSPQFDDWQFFEAERLRRLLASALERLAPLLAERGERDAAIETARRWLALDTLHEPAHRSLIRLYARFNQRAAALRQYRACVRILSEELGVPPLEETTRLYQEILENQFVVDQLVGDQLIGDQLTSDRLTNYQLQITNYQSPITNPQLPITHPLPLTGRAAEWAALQAAYAQCRTSGFLLAIEGEIGVGKTRLAQEFATHLQQGGTRALTARCYPGETRLAYGPFLAALRPAVENPANAHLLAAVPPHWLAEAARLLPQLTPGAAPPASEGPGAPTRLFEGVRQVLAGLLGGPVPGLLFIDDLQWADAASLDLLNYLVRRLSDWPVLVIGAWRGEGQAAPLRALVAETARDGYARGLPLGRLTPAHVVQLARGIPGLPETLHPRLIAETEGLPFIVDEYLSAFQRGDAQGAAWQMPASVQELQRARLAALDDTARQLLGAAAVIGRSFDFDVLRETSGRSEEETITALETLIARGLLAEQPGSQRRGASPAYDFTHETLRNVVHTDTSLARRRLLNRRAAQSLLAQNAAPASIARHLQLAGEDAQAAEHFARAGEQARGLYANAEALDHFRAALALGHPNPAAMHEAIGGLQTLKGDYRAAVLSYETAAALSGPGGLPRLELKLGNLHHRRGDYDLAASHFEAALDLLAGTAEDALRARIYVDWSRTAAQQGDATLGRELAQRGLDLAGKESAPGPLGQAHNLLGILARREGDSAGARVHLQTALEIAGDHPAARLAALNNLALVLGDTGQFAEAIALIEEALAVCLRVGDRHREAALLNHLADFHHARGDEPQAMAYLKQAVGIFAEIGVEAGDLQPEIWKLTEW